MIYTDEMQFSDLGCYGGEIPTPNIDLLASEGILFANAYTVASMCTPSRYSVLAGQFPGRCTAPSFKKENPIGQPYNIAWNSWITADKKTLPRVLSENGFVTGMAGKWHVGRISDKTVLPAFLPDEDLDHPDTQSKLTEEQSVYQGLVETHGGFDDAASVVWGNYDGHSLKAMRFHNFPWMVKGAIAFLEKCKGSSKPFFLYFAPTAVHGPNHVADLSKDITYTPGGRDTTLQGLSIDVMRLNEQLSLADPKTRHRYTGMAQTDHAVRLIREKLADTGLDHNTVIVFISDHNVEPGKATSFEKGIRVPMIIYWPGMMPGRISKSLVQNADIYPTILEAAGIELPEGYKLDHVPSYVKAWPQAHSALAMNGFSHYFDQDQLYNLKDDPYEQHNLYETMSSSGELTLLVDALENHLHSFDYPFDLARIPFMETVEYRELTKKNLAFDLLSIPWLRRDHGFILWPPEQE